MCLLHKRMLLLPAESFASVSVRWNNNQRRYKFSACRTKRNFQSQRQKDTHWEGTWSWKNLTQPGQSVKTDVQKERRLLRERHDWVWTKGDIITAPVHFSYNPWLLDCVGTTWVHPINISLKAPFILKSWSQIIIFYLPCSSLSNGIYGMYPIIQKVIGYIQ